MAFTACFNFWKMQFCCCPRVGRLHTVLSPTLDFLNEPPWPHRGAFAAFPNKNDKCLRKLSEPLRNPPACDAEQRFETKWAVLELTGTLRKYWAKSIPLCNPIFSYRAFSCTRLGIKLQTLQYIARKDVS